MWINKFNFSPYACVELFSVWLSRENVNCIVSYGHNTVQDDTEEKERVKNKNPRDCY